MVTWVSAVFDGLWKYGGNDQLFSRSWKSVKKWIMLLRSWKVCEFWLLLSNWIANNSNTLRITSQIASYFSGRKWWNGNTFGSKLWSEGRNVSRAELKMGKWVIYWICSLNLKKKKKQRGRDGGVWWWGLESLWIFEWKVCRNAALRGVIYCLEMSK